eukprot:756601-Hanusia_phi.AAC.2
MRKKRYKGHGNERRKREGEEMLKKGRRRVGGEGWERLKEQSSGGTGPWPAVSSILSCGPQSCSWRAAALPWLFPAPRPSGSPPVLSGPLSNFAPSLLPPQLHLPSLASPQQHQLHPPASPSCPLCYPSHPPPSSPPPSSVCPRTFSAPSPSFLLCGRISLIPAHDPRVDVKEPPSHGASEGLWPGPAERDSAGLYGGFGLRLCRPGRPGSDGAQRPALSSRKFRSFNAIRCIP